MPNKGKGKEDGLTMEAYHKLTRAIQGVEQFMEDHGAADNVYDNAMYTKARSELRDLNQQKQMEVQKLKNKEIMVVHPDDLICLMALRAEGDWQGPRPVISTKLASAVKNACKTLIRDNF